MVRLKFVNNDLFVNKLEAEVGENKIAYERQCGKFLSMLNVSPEKLVLEMEDIYTVAASRRFQGTAIIIIQNSE
jgi:hypothetical protein